MVTFSLKERKEAVICTSSPRRRCQLSSACFEIITELGGENTWVCGPGLKTDSTPQAHPHLPHAPVVWSLSRGDPGCPLACGDLTGSAEQLPGGGGGGGGMLSAIGPGRASGTGEHTYRCHISSNSCPLCPQGCKGVFPAYLSPSRRKVHASS